MILHNEDRIPGVKFKFFNAWVYFVMLLSISSELLSGLPVRLHQLESRLLQSRLSHPPAQHFLKSMALALNLSP